MTITAGTPDDKLLMALGALVVAGSQIELRVSLLAGALFGVDQRVGIYLFGRENTSRGLELISEALKATADCEAKTVATRWKDCVRHAYRKRNEVIHATFGRDHDGSATLSSLTKSLVGPAFESVLVSATDITTVTNDLACLQEQFDQTVCAALIRDLPYAKRMLGHGE